MKSQPVSQSVNQSVGQSVSQSVRPLVSQPVSELVLRLASVSIIPRRIGHPLEKGNDWMKQATGTINAGIGSRDLEIRNVADKISNC